MASNPFKYVNAINSGAYEPLGKDYSKFLTGRALSYYVDTIMLANAINVYPNIDDDLHYRFLKGTVTPKKRFSKWAKPQAHPRASAISAYYQIPMLEAYQIEHFFTDQQIDDMSEMLKQKDKQTGVK